MLTFRFLPSEFAPTADVGRTVVLLEAPEGASSSTRRTTRAGSKQIVQREKEQYGDIERVMMRVPGNLGRRRRRELRARFVVLKDWHERTRTAQRDRAARS